MGWSTIITIKQILIIYLSKLFQYTKFAFVYVSVYLMLYLSAERSLKVGNMSVLSYTIGNWFLNSESYSVANALFWIFISKISYNKFTWTSSDVLKLRERDAKAHLKNPLFDLPEKKTFSSTFLMQTSLVYAWITMHVM